MKLTTDRLFRSGEFKRLRERVIVSEYKVSIFPCQIWFTPTDDRLKKVAVGIAVQSQNGEDFSCNLDMLRLLESRLRGQWLRNAYIALCSGDEKNEELELISHCTLLEQLKRLKNVEAKEGKRGKFYWLNEKGYPNEEPPPKPSKEAWERL